MQNLLSFDQAPPISAPLRFFLTAPLFAMLAGLLLLYSGPELFASRWMPATLALTHLFTAGFLLQVMLGALQQLLPVVVGANIAQPLRVATWVHASTSFGALALTAAFLTYAPWLFGCAAALLATGVLVFLAAAARAMRGIVANNPTILGLQLALLGLGVTVLSGALLALALGLQWDIPLLQLTDLHLGWGLMAWSCSVLAAVGFVAVPMFQLTPEYPPRFARAFVPTALGCVLLWTASDLAGWAAASTLFAAATVAAAGTYCLVTLHLLRNSKRAKNDATHRFWRYAMLSGTLACALWLVAQFVDGLGQWPHWPMLFGVLLVLGGFASVTLGMLYKIVPFLVWLHLQNQGSGRVLAPNMKKVLPQVQIDRQMRAHFVAYALLLLSVIWPAWCVYPAGLALIASNAWLLRNLLYAMGVYRRHGAAIQAAASAADA